MVALPPSKQRGAKGTEHLTIYKAPEDDDAKEHGMRVVVLQRKHVLTSYHEKGYMLQKDHKKLFQHADKVKAEVGPTGNKKRSWRECTIHYKSHKYSVFVEERHLPRLFTFIKE